MADNLLDLYLGSGGSKSNAVISPAATSLTDQYLSTPAVNTNPTVTTNASPADNLIPMGAPVNGKQEYGTQAEWNKRVAASQAMRDAEPGPIMSVIKQLPVDYANNLSSNYNSSLATGTKGINDLSVGKSATGLGEAVLGGAGMVAAPVSAAFDTLIKDPVTQLTGNPEIGEKAALVAGSGLPLGLGTKAAIAQIPKVKALDTLVEAIGQDNLPDVINRLKLNPRLSVMDVSPAVQQMGQKLVTTEGPHQNSFVAAVNDRTAGAKNAIKGAYDESMGAPVDIVKKVEALKVQAQKTGSTLINPIVQNSQPADITNVVKSVDDLIASGGPVERHTLAALKNGEQPPLPLSDTQSKLFQIREQLRGDWDDKPQMFLDVNGEQGAHAVQSNLRAEAQSLLESQDPKDRLLGGKLMGIRNKLVDAIDKQSIPKDENGKPLALSTDAFGNGPYKQALSKYADDKQVQEAFQKGQDILKNRPGNIEDRPEALTEWLKTAKPEEVQALKEGARAAIDTQIRGLRNTVGRKGVEIPDVEFNADKLKQIFGDKEIESTFQKLKDERDIADTNNKLLQGSQTAMRMKADSRVDLPAAANTPLGSLPLAAAEIGGILATHEPGIGSMLYLGSKGIGKLAHATNVGLAKMRNSSLSDLMTAKGEARDNLIKALESRVIGPKQLLLQKTQNLMLPIAPP